MLPASWINDVAQGLGKKTLSPGWGIQFTFSLKTCLQDNKRRYQCATINQDVPLKGQFTLLLQQNYSPNPDFQDQFYFKPMIQALPLIL